MKQQEDAKSEYRNEEEYEINIEEVSDPNESNYRNDLLWQMIDDRDESELITFSDTELEIMNKKKTEDPG